MTAVQHSIRQNQSFASSSSSPRIWFPALQTDDCPCSSSPHSMPPPASPGAPVEPYVAHLLARLESDLAFLTTAGHLTPASQAAILSHLHTPAVAPSLSPQLSGISATGGRFVPPPPARLNSPLAVASSTPPPPSAPSAPVPASAGTARRVVSCRAVWDYVQNQVSRGRARCVR